MGRRLALYLKPYPSLPVGRSCEKLVRVSARNRGGHFDSVGYDGDHEHATPQCKIERSLCFLCPRICTGILSEIEGSNSRFSILAAKDLKVGAKHIMKIRTICHNKAMHADTPRPLEQ